MTTTDLPRRLVQAGLLLGGLYAVQLLLDLTATRPDGDPPLTLLAPFAPLMFKVTFWCLMAGWLVAAGTFLVARLRHAYGRRAQLVVAVALLAPYAVLPIGTVGTRPGLLLLCLPSTAFGLWAVYRFQRWRRLPPRAVLAVFGWGALIATGFAAMHNSTVLSHLILRLFSEDAFATVNRAMVGATVSAGFGEELAKGCAVLIAYLVWRNRFDGPVTGIVLGAATGLGFNLVESVEYIGMYGFSGYQYYVRQSLGLMAAHTAFTAVLGAGFGTASLLSTRRERVIAIALGYLGAAGAHFGVNVIFRALSDGTLRLPWEPGTAVQMLIVTPLLFLILQGPMVLLYVLLLWRGTVGQGQRMAVALRAEAARPDAGVREEELDVLLDPRKRGWLRLVAWRRHGWAAYRALGRLHVTQYEVGASAEREPERAERLRMRIPELRARLRTALTEPQPAGAAA